MNNKMVFIVEDNPVVGKNMQKAFLNRGFDTIHTLSSDEAWEKLNMLQQVPDLVVLDMHLGHGLNGAELGIQLRNKFGEVSPDFLIYSGHSDSNYFHDAIRLGAGIYLDKTNERGYLPVITHGRVLIARRLLKRSLGRISGLIKNYSSIDKAFLGVISEIIYPELESVLGLPYFCVLSLHGHHFPVGCEVSDIIQNTYLLSSLQELAARVYPNCSSLEAHLTKISDKISSRVFKKIYDGMLVPLYQFEDIQVSLIFETVSFGLGSLKEQASVMAPIFCEHFHPGFVDSIFSSIKTRLEIELRKRDQLESIGRIFTSIGRESREIFIKARTTQEIVPGAIELPRLEKLSRELNSVGEQLIAVSEESHSQIEVDAVDLIRTVWEELEPRRIGSLIELEIMETCCVIASYPDMFLAVKRILIWMLERAKRRGIEGQNIILVGEQRLNDMVAISFRDFSPRLQESLLDTLFQPFTPSSFGNDGIEERTGLFTAKTLIEIANEGKLYERAPKNNVGHILEMVLHSPRNTVGDDN